MEERTTRLELDKALYDRRALLKAVYRFTDRAFPDSCFPVQNHENVRIFLCYFDAVHASLDGKTSDRTTILALVDCY